MRSFRIDSCLTMWIDNGLDSWIFLCCGEFGWNDSLFLGWIKSKLVISMMMESLMLNYRIFIYGRIFIKTGMFFGLDFLLITERQQGQWFQSWSRIAIHHKRWRHHRSRPSWQREHRGQQKFGKEREVQAYNRFNIKYKFN